MILTAGEALIDWVSRERGATLAAARHFERAPGGAPLNVAVGLARLGVRAGFAGCLAEDPFGDALAALLAAEGVDASLVRRVMGCQTRMAYVTTRADGDRELAAFSRVACADAAIAPSDLPVATLDHLDAFYFGSLILQGAPARGAVLEAAARVRAAGGLVMFDPNVRLVLWPDRQKLLRVLEAALTVATVVKLGEDELALLGTLGPGITVLTTHGAQGAEVRWAGGQVRVAAPAVDVVDTTGAGDGFVAGVLAELTALKRADERLAAVPDRLDAAGWTRVLTRASAVGGLVCTRTGAIAALPTRAELDAFSP
ncbi:MAG: putative fructokinase [Cyanobacteria bacterium RYN_339]|nr:putative fructokinase [Cyanobacteria bacterium RYN_339]